MHSHKYIISFFNTNKDKLAKQESLSFDELKTRLSKAARRTYTSKDELEAMICGKFTTENNRTTDHLGFRSVITYDIDNYKHNLKKLTEDCELCLKDVKYLYYTTVSSTYSNPRLRILVFPNSNIATYDYSGICKNLARKLFNDDIFEAIDSCSYKPCQLMYVPCIEPADFKSKSNNGAEIDIDKYRDTLVIKPTNDNFLSDYKNVPLANYDEARVRKTLKEYDVKETDRNEWFTVCQALHHQFSGSDIGLEIFREWSLRDPRYSQEHIIEISASTYKSIDGGCDNPITFASVIAVVNEKTKVPAIGEINRMFKKLDRNVFVDVTHNKKGEIIGVDTSFTNFQIMCHHYKITLSYDIISKEIVSNLNVKSQNSLIGTIQSLMGINKMHMGMAITYINMMGEENPINSFKDKLDTVTWDGADRLNDFYNTVIVNEKYKEMRDVYLRKWIQQMLYLTLYEGNRKGARNLLVLQGKQYSGKSTWVKSLLPTDLFEFIGDSLQLNTNNSTHLLTCLKKIFVELGELEQSFTSTDINQFKAFFGKIKDELNIKYLSSPVTYLRTTSFVATTNDVAFLKDKTGSTRFLVLPIQEMKGFHGIDMLQLYKQIIETIGYIDFELNDEEREKQRVINEEFEQRDPIMERLESCFRQPLLDEKGIWVNCTRALELTGMNPSSIRKTHMDAAGDYLGKAGFERRATNKAWYVKLKKENNYDVESN